MSNAIYPSLPGLKPTVRRVPRFKTNIDESASGREFRAALMLYPTDRYVLGYEFLRDRNSTDELRTLMGFFRSRRGSFDSFLFDDEDDNAVTGQVFGTGNGATTQFQLVRSLGGFLEPVNDVNGTPSIYRTDWQGAQQIYSTARTNHVLRSEELEGASWSKTNLAVNGAAFTAPDGTSSARRVEINTTANASHVFSETSTLLQPGTAQAGTVFLKAGEVQYFRIHMSDAAAASNHVRIQVDAANGTVYSAENIGAGTGCAGTVEDLGDGWFKFRITGTPNPGSTNSSRLEVYTLTALGASASYAGTVGHGFQAWGLQHEAGAGGAYIKTTGATASVTDYALNSTGLVTLAAAPLSGASLTWTGAYHWRVRFMQDELEFEKFMWQLWQLGKVELKVLKP